MSADVLSKLIKLILGCILNLKHQCYNIMWLCLKSLLKVQILRYLSIYHNTVIINNKRIPWNMGKPKCMPKTLSLVRQYLRVVEHSVLDQNLFYKVECTIKFLKIMSSKQQIFSQLLFSMDFQTNAGNNFIDFINVCEVLSRTLMCMIISYLSRNYLKDSYSLINIRMLCLVTINHYN